MTYKYSNWMWSSNLWNLDCNNSSKTRLYLTGLTNQITILILFQVYLVIYSSMKWYAQCSLFLLFSQRCEFNTLYEYLSNVLIHTIPLILDCRSETICDFTTCVGGGIYENQICRINKLYIYKVQMHWSLWGVLHLGLAKLVNCNQILGHVADQDCIEFIDSIMQEKNCLMLHSAVMFRQNMPICRKWMCKTKSHTCHRWILELISQRLTFFYFQPYSVDRSAEDFLHLNRNL